MPLGQVLRVASGSALQDVLFAQGVEFPCGGRGRCNGCKIRLLGGSLPVTDEDQELLSGAEIADGWRLACRAKASSDLKIELAQWEATILADDSTFSFSPRQGLGVAIDLGTTTLVAQLLNLETGHVLAVRTALNAQAKHGADVMSRIEFAVSNAGQPLLEKLIRAQIGELISELLSTASNEMPSAVTGSAADKRLESIVIVGNTVMHHLFSGLSVEPLSHYPFEPSSGRLQVFKATELEWNFPGNPTVYFMPILGGFVGSDILAGILATKLHQHESARMLIDLGTNGEIVIGNNERLLCAATAAGPAFEGARISMGMRAATGAIAEVNCVDGRLRCHVVGNTAPRGICGSGLVDAVATGLDFGWILPNGRLAQKEPLMLEAPVALNQWDVRELQLAKGAIAAGVRILVEQWGVKKSEITEIFLAGAFGNYINLGNGRRIGLLDFPPKRIVPAGNTALLGAKMALFDLPTTDISYPEILRKVTHISLNEAPGFDEVYVEEMTFPETR